jgi:uncharacterized protein YqeY
MNLNDRITEELKTAMRAKDQATLRALRGIKAELLLLKTKGELSGTLEEEELAVLVKMAKQRRDSMTIFQDQNREDLASKEAEELVVIEKFLPKQLSQEEVETAIQDIIKTSGAQGMKDMGKVMGIASNQMKGKADGKAISEVVKKLLNGL